MSCHGKCVPAWGDLAEKEGRRRCRYCATGVRKMRSQTARPECAHGVRLIIYHTERHSREYSDRGFFWNLPALTQAGRKADVSGHAASVCARPCGTDGTAWSRGMEPVHRRVEPVEPVQFKEYTLLIFFKFYRFHRFHTPVHRFHASAPRGSIGSTRLCRTERRR